MDRNEFRKRMQDLKSYRQSNPGKGYWDWRNSLPDNLKYTDDTEYDMQAAYEAGVQPEYVYEDNSYHLPTRDPNTGLILKKSIHPTFWKGLAEDAKLGYDAYFLGDKTYTKHINEEPLQAFAEGGEVGNEEKEYLYYWYTKRREYAKRKMPAMLKQLDSADIYINPDSRIRNIYSTPITLSDDKIKQASKESSIGEYGGYYHPNEGVVLPNNYKQQKYREPLLHELNHVVNTFNSPIFNQVNEVLKGKWIIDRGQEVNGYLTTPSEVQSRLMEFRKLNNLDPTKVYGIPDVKEWRRSGKDADLLNVFDDETILELINTVAYTPNKDVQRVAEGGEVTDDKQQQITNAITYALSRGNVDAAKSLMSRGTPDTNYSYPQSGTIDPVFSLYDTPVLGDAMFTTDAARYAMNGDWTNAGLAMAGLIIPGAIGKGIKKVNRHIPSVKGYKESVENQINRIMDIQDLQKQSDWNNMLYRSAEQVYEPDVIDRAVTTGTTDRLNRVRNMYENDLENMPKIRMTDELNGARGRVQLTKEAEQRYRQGIKPGDSDFEILVDRNIDPTQEVIDHELRHWNQYMEQGSPNINITPTSKRSGVKPTSKNRLDPNHSDYYGKQGESEAYMLNVYRDMKQKGYQINLKNFKKYYNNLKDIDTKKRAISQFSSLEDAYKWMQSMPLIGAAGVIAMNNKEQSN